MENQDAQRVIMAAAACAGALVGILCVQKLLTPEGEDDDSDDDDDYKHARRVSRERHRPPPLRRPSGRRYSARAPQLPINTSACGGFVSDDDTDCSWLSPSPASPSSPARSMGLIDWSLPGHLSPPPSPTTVSRTNSRKRLGGFGNMSTAPGSRDGSQPHSPLHGSKTRWDFEGGLKPPCVEEDGTFFHGWQGFSMAEALQLAESTHKAVLRKKPAEVLEELQKGNVRFWTGLTTGGERSVFERRALISKQFPTVAILGCADARVPVELVFDAGLGDIFCIRVAGNCLDTTTLGSLQYAVHHLKVKVVVVLGHEGCHAVREAAGMGQRSPTKQTPSALRSLLGSLREGLDVKRLEDITESRARERAAAVTNVRRQLESLREDQGVAKRVEDGELLCVGAFYELSSGIVDFL
eukprot:TRINITY_DN93722_c0_g1_i1.p1 TRINITY_DN93722_c0_g1~~TRINITY_DN93722_c0_g1_i1.p1  ORF type:complete len:442 (+),score=80.12 TRINITY_DN93722_c0_g1_i1:94-1326(+)